MVESRLNKISRTMIAGLRHKPESIFKHSLNKEGWLPIDIALSTMGITRDELELIVKENNKNRFEIKGDFIRARQGHTLVEVEITYKKEIPPVKLYHGTTEAAIENIAKKGLLKMKRHHVHLSADIEVAKNVGNRRVTRTNKMVIMTIDAKTMLKDGKEFFRTENGVWLTEIVEPKYIILTEIF